MCMGVGSWGQKGAVTPWIFIHGTNIDSGLIVLFFGLFCYFSIFFLLPPIPGIFSADVLGYVGIHTVGKKYKKNK